MPTPAGKTPCGRRAPNPSTRHNPGRGVVAELDRLAETSLCGSVGRRVRAATRAGSSGGLLAADSAAGLVDDPLGALDQHGEILELATHLSPAGLVLQGFRRFGHRCGGEVGELPGDHQHLCFGFVAASAQPHPDRVLMGVGLARAVGEADLHPGGAQSTQPHGDPPDRGRQQPGVGRVLDVGLDDGRVGTHPLDVDVAALERRRSAVPGSTLRSARSAAAGQLADRRLVRHRGLEPDPTEPSPADRVAHLGAQPLVTEPVAYFKNINRRYVSIGIDGRPSCGSKNERNGTKNRRSSSSASISASSPDSTRIPDGSSNSNNDPAGLQFATRWPPTLVTEGLETIV